MEVGRSNPNHPRAYLDLTRLCRPFLISTSPPMSPCWTGSRTRSTSAQELRLVAADNVAILLLSTDSGNFGYSKRKRSSCSPNSKSIQTRGSECPPSSKNRRIHRTRYHRLCAPALSVALIAHKQFLGLQILEKVVRTRWKALPDDQRAGMLPQLAHYFLWHSITHTNMSGIKNFVVDTIIQIASVEAEMRKQKTFLHKLNLLLVQVRARLSKIPIVPCLWTAVDLETRLATAMANFYQGDCRLIEKLIIALREQHGDFEAAVRGNIRLLR